GRQVLHHATNAPRAILLVAEGQADAAIARQLLGDLRDTLRIVLDLARAILEQVRRGTVVAKYGFHAPLIRDLSEGETIGRFVERVSVLEPRGEFLIRVRGGVARARDSREHRARERLRAEISLRQPWQRRAKIRCVGPASRDAIALDHPAVGDVARFVAGVQVGARDREVRWNGGQSGHDEAPFRVVAELAVGEWLHLLDLPIDTAERLRDVRVHRALVIAAIELV